MVVVDSSALIPLARVGRLELIEAVATEIRTVEGVEGEVLGGGKPGVAALESFFSDVAVAETPERSADVAEMEGIAATDAAVVLLADADDDVLLADAGMNLSPQVYTRVQKKLEELGA